MDDSRAVLCRAQALAIASVNDQWGVFSRSRVQLLPHQLWVCRQVTRAWPIRWLVADDVGLGKTIEAGLILEPLIASGRVRRVLVLAPARLVPQWRARMKTMFDIRLQEFTADSDRGRISFWETAHQVVASFHTLRMEKPRKRLLQAEPWDLVIMDEAHHFQAQERAATLTCPSISMPRLSRWQTRRSASNMQMRSLAQRAQSFAMVGTQPTTAAQLIMCRCHPLKALSALKHTMPPWPTS
jgi:hypothetical protein